MLTKSGNGYCINTFRNTRGERAIASDLLRAGSVVGRSGRVSGTDTNQPRFEEPRDDLARIAIAAANPEVIKGLAELFTGRTVECNELGGMTGSGVRRSLPRALREPDFEPREQRFGFRLAPKLKRLCDIAAPVDELDAGHVAIDGHRKGIVALASEAHRTSSKATTTAILLRPKAAKILSPAARREFKTSAR